MSKETVHYVIQDGSIYKRTESGDLISEIKAGDVVALRSGGPRMTVERVMGLGGLCERVAHCTWHHSDTGEALYGRFHPISLRLVGTGWETMERQVPPEPDDES